METSGRVLGALPIIIILYNLFFFLLLNTEDVIFQEIKVMVILLCASVLLYFITWFFEIIGGTLLIINSIITIIYFIKLSSPSQSNSNAIALYPLPFLLCGVIAIYCALKERFPSRKSTIKESKEAIPSKVK